MATKTLAVMFTDIKGFTARTSSETRAELRTLLERHERLLKPVFGQFGGRVVKTIGDAFLVCFTSPTDSVICGLAIQEVLRKHNAEVAETDRLEVRIAINIGDVEERDGDIFGEAVNLASRLEGITEPGEVWFTEAVYLTMNRHEAPSAEVGERTFKGIPHPVRVYKVLFDPKSEQIRRIMETVRIEDGVARVDTPRPSGESPAVAPDSAEKRRSGSGIGTASTRSGSRLYLGLAAVVVVAVAAAGGMMAMRASAVRKVEARVDELLAKDAGAALEYLDREVERRDYLLPLSDRRRPAIEAAVKVREYSRKHGSGSWFFSAVREELFNKHPDNPEVPWVVAEFYEKQLIPGVRLWPYKLALERGGPYRDDPRIPATAFEVLSRYRPEVEYGPDAHALLRTYYDEERTEWAGRMLTSGSGFNWVNAHQILLEKKDPRAADPVSLAVRALIVGTNTEASLQALADADPADTVHALKTLKTITHPSRVPTKSLPGLNEAIRLLESDSGSPNVPNEP